MVHICTPPQSYKNILNEFILFRTEKSSNKKFLIFTDLLVTIQTFLGNVPMYLGPGYCHGQKNVPTYFWLK